jgi:UrcA family protein
MQRSTVVAVVAALVLIAPNAARAAELRKQVEISLVDIDTTTGRGADQALRRIRDAAEEACDVRPGLQPYHERAAARACVAEAVSQAVDDLGNPVVTARHRGNRSFASAGERS